MSWLRLQSVVDAALDLPTGERKAFVVRECGEDEALRDEVLRLLRACERAEGFLDRPAAELAADMVVEGEGETAEAGVGSRIPPRVGPYRIVAEAGRGGMGTVYLAERDDGQFTMQVALKLVPAAAATEGAIRRFLEERQILARLQHPNIARVLDGGVSDDGRPYLVMEYVEGDPIDRFCDRRRLSIEARLALFIDVCRAVQFAHQNLVVHRDLKPGNILVSERHGPKLLDFGIAKLLDSEAGSGQTGLTRTGMRPMTPDYASPEQVRGDRVTTATDIYALGLLLYRLLVGRAPYAADPRSAFELERAILEEEPTAPSVVLGRASDVGAAGLTPTEIADARGTTPQRLARRLRGDLDAIVARALRKQPAERYATADQLAEDLQRFLEGRPVLARRGTRLYAASRLVRRHRVAVSAGALVVLSLIGGGVGIAWQARAAAIERDRVRVEAATSARVSAFLEELFRVADPEQGRGATVSARELLDRGAARIERELAEEPRTRAALMTVMGRAYRNLGEYPQAVALLQSALEVPHLNGPDDLERAIEVHLELARVRALQEELAEAERHAREALRLSGGRHAETVASAAALAALGDVLHRRGQLAQAEELLRASLERRRRLLGERDREVAATLAALGHLLRSRGEPHAAEPLYREALAIQREALGEDHPELATTMNDLAVLLIDANRYEAADSFLRQAIEVRRHTLGEDHPDVAIAVNNLAALLERRGNSEEAEERYREALRLKIATLGEEHPSVAVTMNNLALLLANGGRHAAADSLLRISLELRRRAYGDEHPSVAAALHNIASQAQRQGDPATAERLYREAAEMRRRLLGPDHPDLANSLMGVALLAHERGAHAESEPLLREALRIWLRVYPSESPQVAQAESSLGACLLAQRRRDEAAPLLRRGYEALLRLRGPDHRSTLRAADNLAKLSASTGER